LKVRMHLFIINIYLRREYGKLDDDV